MNNNMTVRSLTFVCSMALSIACSANNHVEEVEVVDYAIKAAAEAFATVNERVRQCTELENSTAVPKLDKKKLTALNATRMDALAAIAYWQSQNSWLCARDELQTYNFHMGTLETLLKELEIEPDEDLRSLKLLPTSFTYPSKMGLEWAVMYSKLSQSKQQYFESVIGSDPYNFNEAMDINDLRYKP